MAQTINSVNPTYTTGLLTGPSTILVTKASRLKCGSLKVLIALTNASDDNFAYTGVTFTHSDSVNILVAGDYYLKFELAGCDDNGVAYVDIIESP